MGAFICQISEDDWEITHEIGLYGNRALKPDGSAPLRNQDRLSIIRDLIGLKVGDLIFFHVIRRGEISTLHGVYKARSTAFFDKGPLEYTGGLEYKTKEKYPHRFLFEPHENYINLCLRDASVNVTEFYIKIEQQRIWSQVTLENERNIEKRAVRKIADSDAQEIIKLLLRDFMDDKDNQFSFNLQEYPDAAIELRNKLDSIGSIENAIKALFIYDLREGRRYITDFFGTVLDFMNEVFVAQTIRRLFDLLVISKYNNEFVYNIIECKTHDFSDKEITQILGYLDLFRQRSIFRIGIDKIVGFLLSHTTQEEIAEFVSLNNQLGVFDLLKIINYEPLEKGKDAKFTIDTGEDKGEVNLEVIIGFDFECEYNNINEDSIMKLDILKALTNKNVRIKMGSIYNNHYIINRFRKNSKDDKIIGNIMIGFYKNGFEWNDLKIFLKGLKEYVEGSPTKDYMDIIPIIITTKTNSKVIRFIELYNKFHKRKSIELYYGKSKV